MSHVDPGTRARVLVVGDVMLDEYWDGVTTRVIPDDCAPVVDVERATRAPGGAANVAANIVALGGSCRLVGAVGTDEAGAQLLELCSEHGIDVSSVLRAHMRPTTRKIRVRAHGDTVVRLDIETRSDLSEPDAQLCLAIVGNTFDAVVLSDYCKGTLTPVLVRPIIDWCRAHGVPVLVDSKAADASLYHGASWLVPSLAELTRLATRSLDSHDAIVAAARQLIRGFTLQGVLVTMGAGGLLRVTAREAEWLPSSTREVRDATGAGDTAIAAFTLGLCGGLTPQDAARFAGCAAGRVVEKDGTGIVTLAELANRQRS